MTLPPAVLDRYSLEAELGRGSMGVVYRAHDTRLARQVALKVLYPIRARGEDLKQMEERFLREARLAARLVHPNIVTVFDILHAENQWFLVMELVEGRTLRQVLRDEDDIPVWSACDWILQAARALECAHQGGVIHRDIKPENLLLQRDGRIRIMDFGVALSVDSPRLTAAGQTMGTPAYFAPELLHSQPSTPSSDLFALGVMFYELVSGDNPYAGGRPIDVLMRIANKRPAPLDTLCTDLPPGLSEVVEKMMHPEPSQRFESAQAVIRELERLVVGGTDVVEEGLAVSTLSGRPGASEVRNTLVPGLSPQALQNLRQAAANLQAARTANAAGAVASSGGSGSFATLSPSTLPSEGALADPSEITVVPVSSGLNSRLASRQQRVWAALAGFSLLVGGSWAVSSGTFTSSGHTSLERPLHQTQAATAGQSSQPSAQAAAQPAGQFPPSATSGARPAGNEQVAYLGQPQVAVSGGAVEGNLSGPSALVASVGAGAGSAGTGKAVGATSSAQGPSGTPLSPTGLSREGGPAPNSPPQTTTAVGAKETRLPFESGLADKSRGNSQPVGNSQKVTTASSEWDGSACAQKRTPRKTMTCLEESLASVPPSARSVKASAATQKVLLPLLETPEVRRQAWALAPKALPKESLVRLARKLLKSTADYDDRRMAAAVLEGQGKKVSEVELRILDLGDAECANRRDAAYYFRSHPTASAKSALEAAYQKSFHGTPPASEVRGMLGFVKKAFGPKSDATFKAECDYVPLKAALDALK